MTCHGISALTKLPTDSYLQKIILLFNDRIPAFMILISEKNKSIAECDP